MKADYKRLGSEFDRQQEKLKEVLKVVQTALARKTKALAEEQTKAVAREKLGLNKNHYE